MRKYILLLISFTFALLSTASAQSTSATEEKTEKINIQNIIFDSDQEPDDTSMQLLDLLQQLKQAHKKEESSTGKKETSSIPSDLVRLFTFRELDAAILAANTLQGFYQGKNTLYKDPQEGDYYLILHQSQHTIAEFNQVIHLINSYLQSKKYVTGTQAYYEEHFQKIIIGNALQQLGEIA